MTPRRILVVGWLVFLLYAYPGYMTPSAVDMLLEARYGTYTDWHSPLMTAFWNVINTVFTGPPSMLLIQSGGFLFGGYVLLRQTLSDRAAAIASASILVFPPVIAVMAVVGEHALLVALLVGAAALFTVERRWARIAGLACIVLACGMREGAWLTALPILLVGFRWRDDQRPLERYGIAFAAWLAAALLAWGLTHVLIDNTTRRNDAALAAIDIQRMLAKSDKLVDPGLGKATTQEGIDALVEARTRMRSEDPGAYVEARFAHAARLLIGPRNKVFTKDSISPEHRVVAAHGARPSAVQKLMQKGVRLVSRTPLFAPIVYVALAVLALPFARRQRTALALLASAILLTFVLSIVTWDFEYRHMTWPIVATLVALVLVVNQRIASASRE